MTRRHSIDLQPLPAFTDLIVQRDRDGLPHCYARNERGLHVPIETLNVESVRRAARWRSWHSGSAVPVTAEAA